MKKEMIWDVAVIGGGPSGMMAAGRALERGRKVILLEKNPTLGKKLLITGGGRCNVTNNTPDIRLMLQKYKKSADFLFSAFTQFGVTDTLNFFHNRGMPTKEEAEGRMFPVSNTAKSVFDVLVQYMKNDTTEVEVKTGVSVSDISFDKVKDMMVITLADKSVIHAKTCILATGGTSRPETGSTGEGFRWLKKLGHTIIENNVALVPIAIRDNWVKKLGGVTLKDIKLTTFIKDIDSGIQVKQKVYKGKLLFTHFGISGPTVLNMSRDVGELLHNGEGSIVTIMLDLFPTTDSGVLRKRLQTILVEESNKKIKNSLSKLIPSALVEPILSIANIDKDTPNHSIRSEERKILVSTLKSIPLHVSSLLGADKAVVSSGGVVLDEVNFKTMQSKIIPQLYLVGDVLNIDRPSGGYSLQLCWTTGYVAGDNC
jgi:predicted Rossmann fold flavoprotein